MDKIQDKANKIFNDVCKKKIGVGKNTRSENKEQAKQSSYHLADLSCNSCFYCQKVFINSKFLLKHIMRRHANDMVQLHKNCLKQESNNNSSDIHSLVSFLECEFSVLKNELMTVKQTIADKNGDTDTSEENKQDEYVTDICKSEKNSANTIATDIDSNEFKALKEKICDVEKNIQGLCTKFEELDNVLKNEVLLKQDVHKHMAFNEEKILQAQVSQFSELRQILFKDMETVSNQLYQSNSEEKTQLLELRNEIKSLDCAIETIKRQITSPEFLTEIEKKLMHHVLNFLDNTRHKKPERCKSRLSRNKMNSPLREKRKSINKRFDNKAITSLRCKDESHMSSVTPDELSFLIAEKLSELGIGPSTSKISSAEFDEKVKHLNADKERCMRKYHNFSKIYDDINTYADHITFKLKNKKCRKIRFSEPLTSGIQTLSSSLISDKDCKASPLLKNENLQEREENKQFTDAKSQKKTFPVSESRGFDYHNDGACGDCTMNFGDNQRNSFKHIESSAIKKLRTSSPVGKVHDSQELNVTFVKDCSVINPVSSSSNQIFDNASLGMHKNSVYYSLTNYPVQNEETAIFKSLKKYSREVEDSEHRSEDEDLKSLSSWGDGDSPECS